MAVSNTSKSRIIVDCQLLQTSDRNRGMGLYLYSILSALASMPVAKNNIEWVFILNDSLPKLSVDDNNLLSAFKPIVLQTRLLSHKDHQEFSHAESINRVRLDDLLTSLESTSISKTIFFIPAMFSSEIFPVFPTIGTTNLMLFHDVIPFLYHNHYFADHEGIARRDYAQRFKEVYRSDLFVTNSQTTADDLTIYFGVDSSRIVAILGAGADRSTAHPTRPKSLPKSVGDYVLMPSGDDYRKNNNVAAAAFASLKTESKLVITSNFSIDSQRTLKRLCPSVIFTGSVDGDEYMWLLDNALCVLFPSEYEGLGMPILEAVARNATVVCSNIPVFAEISADAFFYFDAKSASSIAAALENVLGHNNNLVTDKTKAYQSISSRFSWKSTAELFLQACAQAVPAGRKPKLAIFCPSPSSYSAVGKYALQVHSELSRLYNVDYYFENGLTQLPATRPNILEYAANYYPAEDFNPQTHDYDFVLYNIGNSEFHVSTILNSLRYPANVIIHDTQLNGIFDYMVNQKLMSQERQQFEAILNEKFSCKHSSCLVSIATNQKTVFCNSKYAQDAINEFGVSANKVKKIVLPVGVPAISLKRSAKPVVSFAGIISEDKGINLVKEVCKLGVKVKIFGFGVLGDSPLLNDIDGDVEVINDLTDKEFQDALRTSDILVNYRVNYNGETSLSTLEAMRYGTAVIVKKIGWYDELPDDTVVKVDSENEVIRAVSQLLAETSKREAIGQAARKFLAKNYSYTKYAEIIAEGLKV